MAHIYQIVNTENNKRYVGSSSNYKRRFSEHLKMLENNSHHSKHLQRAWNKYGKDVFKFELVEECELEQQFIREQFYIDTLSPEYNMDLVAKHGETKSVVCFRNTCEYCKQEFDSVTKRRKVCDRCGELKKAIWNNKDYTQLLHLKHDTETEMDFYNLFSLFESKDNYTNWSYVGDEDLSCMIDEWIIDQMEK